MMRAILLLLCLSVSVLCGDLPKYFPVCNRDDPDLDNCLVNAAHTVRPHLRKGVRELNIPSLDPLILPEIKLEQGTQAISYKVTLKNVTIEGMQDYFFKELRYDPKTVTLSGVVAFDKISLTTIYDVDGKILVAPIKGRGVLSVNTGPINGTFVMTGKLETKEGHEYITPVDIDIKIRVSSGSGHFDGVINDNEELSRATNRILNENSQELLRDSIPALERVGKELLSKLWSGINRIVPYNKLLPVSS